MQPRCFAVLGLVAALSLAWIRRVDEPPIELPLREYAGPLRTVDGQVGGKQGRFLLDTGGGYTIVAPAPAAAAGSTAFGRGTGFRHDGTRMDGRRGTALPLAFGGFTRHDEVGIVDLDAMLQGLPHLDGIVSLETFAGRAVTFDFARERMWIETAASMAARVAGMRELRIRFGRQGGGASLDVFVAIEGTHGPQWFELDCGNTQGVLVAPHALAELGLPEQRPGAKANADLTIAGLGRTPCTVIVKEMIYDGLLDAGFFRRHVLTLDLAGGRAWAVAN